MDNFVLNVKEDFNIFEFAEKLAEMYRVKGFIVNVANFNNSVVMQFNKGCGGMNMLFGMGLGIKASATVNNGILNITFSEAEWTGKIIGLVVGWLFCLIPFITAVIGCVRQSSLPKDISNDAMIIASSM